MRTAAFLSLILASVNAHAGGSCWNGRCGGGGISPGAAVGIGLGSLALGAVLASPRAWAPPTVIAPTYYPPPPYAYVPYRPQWCWNGWYSYAC